MTRRPPRRNASRYRPERRSSARFTVLLIIFVKVKTALNSNDKLFRDVRDLNFAVVGPILNQKAKLIDEHYKALHTRSTTIPGRGQV